MTDATPARPRRRRYAVKAGDVLGAWTALDDYRHDLIPCRCTCGHERHLSIRYLLKHVDDPCTCQTRKGRPPGRAVGRTPSRILIPAGTVFGRLTALADIAYASDHVPCRCECGNTTMTPTAFNLRAAKTMSCGCLAQERRTKHGLCKHPLYQVWFGMIRRCTHPNVREYPQYGGRGITVCERWTGLPDGLLNFAADMGERPAGMTLERMKVDGNYEPGNCKWATILEQNRNRRTVTGLTRERDELLAKLRALTCVEIP
jgi:hypothetical protein